MGLLKQIAQSIYKKPSLYLFVFFIIFSADRYNRWVNYSASRFPLVDDVDQFYSYLPAIFIHNDLSFKFPNNYWTVPGKDGNRIARTTYGMALMYSPFFFVGHAIAKSGDYEANGYSLPYKWSLHFGTFFYVLMGLWFCRKSLLRFFSEAVTFITLISVFLGTNLFYYTFGWGEMCHSYLFSLFSIYIFCTIKWFETKKTNYLMCFSFLAGFCTLIRPTDIVILLFPLLYAVKSKNDLVDRIKLILGLKIKLIMAIIVFMLSLVVQLIYWKIYSGNWIAHTYGSKEGFFFADPQVANFLFSFRKGWFIYTPIMIFILIGIPFLYKTARAWFLFSIVFFCVNVYVLSSWWDWGFGGSFGCRAIIQHYAFFCFGLASFIALIYNLFDKQLVLKMVTRAGLIIVFLWLIVLNYDQSWKYKYALIHHSGMTRDAYFFMFNKDKLTQAELIEYQKLIKPPDTEKMLNGERDQ